MLDLPKVYRLTLLTLALGVALTSTQCKEIPDCNCEEKTALVPPPKPKDVPTGHNLAKDKTHVVMLGSGTPVLEPENSGPAVVVVAGGKSYLVDFGPGVVRRAEQAFELGMEAVDPRQMTHAFATHLHSDHTAGYSDLILTPPVVGREEPLNVFGPPGIKAMTGNILAAYSQDLDIRKSRRGIDDFSGYQVKPIEYKEGLIYSDDNVKVSAFPVKHGKWNNAYGFKFVTKDRTIVISGDTGPDDRVVEECNGCDVLVHEVYCYAGFSEGPEDWRYYHSNYHTSGPELAKLANRARPKLLVLYHKLFFGCTEDQLLKEVSDQYDGKIVLGRDLGAY